MQAVLAAAVVVGAVGCANSTRSTVPAQPFRDESEPKDGFQYYESAVPSPGGESSDKSGDASDTTIEIEIEEEAADSSDATADDDSADTDADEDTGGDGGDGSDEGDEGEDSDESAAP